MKTLEFANLLRPWIAASFVAGPGLLLVSGVLAALAPHDTTWQGVFGQYAGYCFVISNLTSAWLVGRERPRLGLVCALLGWTGGSAMVQAFSGYFALGIAGTAAGFDARATMVAMTETPSLALMAGGMVGLSVPLSQVVLGCSLWASGAVGRASAALIVAGGLVFVGSQAVLNNTGEWISPLLFLGGMAPIGRALWTGAIPWPRQGEETAANPLSLR
ncbi:MAG: hypothetical protein EP330_13890 [Deltaproteobacteria bacterium]|nr:MAG: hypothetical protein EP330_13890 [Deltaproteobacteria bacterium]